MESHKQLETTYSRSLEMEIPRDAKSRLMRTSVRERHVPDDYWPRIKSQFNLALLISCPSNHVRGSFGLCDRSRDGIA